MVVGSNPTEGALQLLNNLGVDLNQNTVYNARATWESSRNNRGNMHIGTFVQNKTSKDSIGIITGRPPIANCWNVRWTKGRNRGTSSIVQESNLRRLSKD